MHKFKIHRHCSYADKTDVDYGSGTLWAVVNAECRALIECGITFTLTVHEGRALIQLEDSSFITIHKEIVPCSRQ